MAATKLPHMTAGLLSPWHVAFLAIVLLLFFGPKRLPEIGRSLGKGMREFKHSIGGEETVAFDAPTPPAAADIQPARTID